MAPKIRMAAMWLKVSLGPRNATATAFSTASVAPALVASAAMNGAVFETIFNVFFKLNYAKTYDGVLATPMGISEIAIGELLWALMRATLYAVAMFVIGLVLRFGTGAEALAWGILFVVMPLSGTFYPVSALPGSAEGTAVTGLDSSPVQPAAGPGCQPHDRPGSIQDV